MSSDQSFEDMANEAAYKALKNNNPNMLMLIIGLIDKGETPAKIARVLQSRGQPQNMVFTIQCAAEHYLKTKREK